MFFTLKRTRIIQSSINFFKKRIIKKRIIQSSGCIAQVQDVQYVLEEKLKGLMLRREDGKFLN